MLEDEEKNVNNLTNFTLVPLLFFYDEITDTRDQGDVPTDYSIYSNVKTFYRNPKKRCPKLEEALHLKHGSWSKASLCCT